MCIARSIFANDVGDVLDKALEGVENVHDTEQLSQVVMFTCMQHRIKSSTLCSVYFR